MPIKSKVNIIIGIVLFLLLITGLGVYVLNQPGLFSKSVLYLLHKSSGISVKEFNVEAIHWSGLSHVEFRNLRMRCKFKGQTYYVSAGQLELDRPIALLVGGSLDLKINSLSVTSSSINASDVSIRARLMTRFLRMQSALGDISSSQVELDRYLVGQLSSLFSITKDQIQFTKLKGSFYEGSINSELMFVLRPQSAFRAGLRIKDVDMKQLSGANPAIFEHMQGLLSGSVLIKSSGNAIEAVEVDLKSPGGFVSSKVLNVFINVLPKGNVFRQTVDRLMMQGDSVSFDGGQVHLVSSGMQRYKASVRLISSQAAIDLRYSYDINIPGGLSEILQLLNHHPRQFS